MSIKRATIQPGPSLENSYEELAASTGITGTLAQQMLPLLKVLSEVCNDMQVWGLTSHTDLWLVASEDESSLWLVQVRADLVRGYSVRYKMKASDAPWPDAFVEGKAPDEATACKLILIAMKNSGGWY